MRGGSPVSDKVAATTPDAHCAGIRITKNVGNSGGTALFNVPLYVASGFSVSFDIQYGPTSAAPADGVTFVLFEQAASAPLVWPCSSRGGSMCLTGGVRVAFPTITYNGGATSAYIRVGVGAGSTGLLSPSDARISLAFLSTSTFGAAYAIATNDRWSYTLTFYPSTNQVLYSIARGAALQNFSAIVDINTAINAAPTRGGGFAWLGFSGATGGSTEEAWVTNVRFLARCPPSSYAPTVAYNISENWTLGSGGIYTATCNTGYAGTPTVLACDAATATLTGSYPVCVALLVSASPSALPQRPFIISKVAGTYLSAGFLGDGGAATSATLSSPSLPCGDSAGNLLIVSLAVLLNRVPA